MKKILLTLSLILCFMSVKSQIVINELDSDTPSTDVKEFIELKSDTPFFPLDGYVLVFYNGGSGTGDKSYYTIDLDGLTTDVNSLVVIGNNLVAPIPDKYLPDSTIQNGPDVVAIYLGNSSDFPDQTTATAANLVFALAHSNSNTGDALTLRTILGISAIYSENANGNTQNHSLQRKADGTYEAKTPTPGALNDGSGVLFNGITISTPAIEYNEGDSIPITFTTQYPVTSTLNFTFSLNSGGFNTSDFTGSTSVSIPTGASTFTTNITIIDDTEDEGDEVLKVNFGTIPNGYKRMNENYEVRIIDNDFSAAAWGTPKAPTYGVVTRSIPAGYYDALEGKSGAALKQAVQDIIANPAVVRAQNYGDVTEILKQADQNPANSNEVWLMYVEQGRSKYKFQSTASNVGSWNREHIYPQSRGGFSNGTNSTPDGINVWLPTSADDINAGHGDAHHIRAEDGPENSSRNNRDYGLDYNGPAGNSGSWRGDVARSLFYMACRYNALSLVNGNPSPDDAASSKFILGDLASLLAWNWADPSDDFEMNRNNIIYTWQQNRNPFIDYPTLADYIFGANFGQTWFSTLSTGENEMLQVGLYPNPAKDRITVSGIKGNGNIIITDMAGAELYKANFDGDTIIQLNLASGVYIARVTSENKSVVKKVVIK